jgi:gas vesicle protein
VLIPFFIGTVVGSLVGFASRLGLKDTVKKLRNSNEELKEKLKQAQEAHIAREYETSILEEKRVDTG